MGERLGVHELDTVVRTDALSLLRGLPDASVNCCVTSPPYFGLRDYGTEGQIGLEESPADYVAALVQVFRELRRVLRDDGTFWLNLGDSYVGATSEYAEGGSAGKNAKVSKKTLSGLPNELRGSRNRALYAAGLPMKSLLMIPHRVALALQADGWIVRSDIVWHKPNCMPESVTDRPTKAHEYLFLLAKCSDYHYDGEAIKEPAQDWGTRDRTNGKYTSGDVPIAGGRHHGLTGIPKQDALGKRTYTGFNERYFAEPHELTRNKRSVWTVPTQPFAGAHFATFPQALIEPCILAGCPVGGIVLDCFFGAGTVGVVAERLGRHWLGSEINAEYVELARARIAGRFAEYQAQKAGEPFTPYMFAAQP